MEDVLQSLLEAAEHLGRGGPGHAEAAVREPPHAAETPQELAQMGPHFVAPIAPHDGQRRLGPPVAQPGQRAPPHLREREREWAACHTFPGCGFGSGEGISQCRAGSGRTG